MPFISSFHDVSWNQSYAAWVGDIVAIIAMFAAVAAAIYAVKTYKATWESLNDSKKQLKLQMRAFYDATMPIITATLRKPRVKWIKNAEEHGAYETQEGVYIPIPELKEEKRLFEAITLHLKNDSTNPAYVQILQGDQCDQTDADTGDTTQGTVIVPAEGARDIEFTRSINPQEDGYKKDANHNFKFIINVTNRYRNVHENLSLESGDLTFMTWAGPPAGPKICGRVNFPDREEKIATQIGDREYPQGID